MMWRQYPLWLRWGLVADGIFLIIFTLSLFTLGGLYTVYLAAYPVYPAYPFIVNLTKNMFGNTANIAFVYAFFDVILFFLLGAIFGWIISKKKHAH